MRPQIEKKAGRGCSGASVLALASPIGVPIPNTGASAPDSGCRIPSRRISQGRARVMAFLVAAGGRAYLQASGWASHSAMTESIQPA